ncbi:MAG: glycosyl transferase, partial [Desulfomonile sp.]|nr:glycosyl transferase [Desulfomonile sp.]
MKADLHVHSKFSRRPAEWILQKLGSPESFTEPKSLYRIAKQRGMSLVTITDHNAIDGCLEISDLPDTFVSEEVTTYFPEDGCKLHVLVYDIDEERHREIQRIRENVYDLTGYLVREKVHHVLAHPLYSVNNRLTVEHVEKTLLLFRNFELNGARSTAQNKCLHVVLSSLTPRIIETLANKHGFEPRHPEPWIKNVTGGSDDHSSLTIGRRYTVTPGAGNLAEFLAGIEQGQSL